MGNVENKKGALLLTRADHLRVGSSPPIDSKFGDDVPKGDTLSDDELGEWYSKQLLSGTRRILGLPNEQRNMLMSFLDPDKFQSNLEYCRGRGIDVADAELLLAELKTIE